MPNTMRVDICYRPLRIGWAVRSGDIEAIQRAIRYSHVLWGGKHNPIIFIDREEEAAQLVKLFRIDIIQPIGDGEDFELFINKFPHLTSPLYGESIFVKSTRWKQCYARALDISNAILHWQKKPEWKYLNDEGIRFYRWTEDDPLANIFLSHLGEFPSPQELGFDYAKEIMEEMNVEHIEIPPKQKIPADTFSHPGLEYISRLGIERHYSIRTKWATPGFYVGHADNPDDLVCHWNLGACDISLLFVDSKHIERYEEIIPEVESIIRQNDDHRQSDLARQVGVWSRQDISKASEIFGSMEFTRFQIGDQFWSGEVVVPPMMYLGGSSTLGVIDEANGIPRIDFALANKPFEGDPYFYTQHLVASISLPNSPSQDEQYIFVPPHIPELNEIYGRTMLFEHEKFRAEPERIGLIINTAEHHSSISSMPTAKLFQSIFCMAGFNSSISNSGRIVKQLLTQLGGVQGARAFKIPGVRELIKKFGPRDTFPRKTANDIIAGKSNGKSSFAPHINLFIEPRQNGTRLTPPDAFAFLVDKGLFRIGVELNCTKCGMSSWTSLNETKQSGICELCGNTYNTTRQLLDAEWRFRRSGILGAERNAQGAVSVSLTLQQLGANLAQSLSQNLYSPSLDLTFTDESKNKKFEIDLCWLIYGRPPHRPAVLLAECKDVGPISPEDFEKDVENMRTVADAFPVEHFDTFILFVKLAAFTEREIELARTLNHPNQHRVILLTQRELEPNRIVDRIKTEYVLQSTGRSPADLAEITTQIYFSAPYPNDDCQKKL